MQRLIVQAILVVAVVLAICAGIAFLFQAYLGPGIKCEEHSVSQTIGGANQKSEAPPTSPVQHLIPPDQRQNPRAEPKDHYYECLVAKYTNELAGFTQILAFVTALLALITGGLVWVGYRQEAMARTHERAYVSGGGPARIRDAAGRPIRPDEGWVSIENYGRTPAVIKRFEWGFCEKNIFPQDRKVSEIIDHKLMPAGTVIDVYEREDVFPPQYAATHLLWSRPVQSFATKRENLLWPVHLRRCLPRQSLQHFCLGVRPRDRRVLGSPRRVLRLGIKLHPRGRRRIDLKLPFKPT